MKQEVKGNLTGIRNTVIAELNSLFEFKTDKAELAGGELINALARYTNQINREIAVYIDRRGQVVQVSVGDSSTVQLPEIPNPKDAKRLSGIRCIHTHPDSGPELSSLDLTSLANLRLDCMAAVEVRGEEPGKIQVAYLQPTNGVLESDKMLFELDSASVSEHPFQFIVRLIEREIAKTSLTTDQTTEKAILVALDSGKSDWKLDDTLAELAELACTAGAEILAVTSQKRPKPDPATFIGQGKARELGMAVQELGANCIIFDDELSPAQMRNLEVLCGCRILDRTTVILDIFAARAQTREGKVQVELAQLKHLLPRLTGLGTALSRLGGGIGTRGPGETKLESDRRHIRRRISELEKDLEGIKKHRNLQRMGRKSVPLPLVSLVGYTNAGKSSLLNALTGSQVLAENKLFATLDPVTRRLQLSGNQEILLTDTVGFVRKLPHHLVAAFRATLEEVVQADILIHVVDSSHSGFTEQIAAVEAVLKELNAEDKPTIMAFNKIDRVEWGPELEAVLRNYPQAVTVSAITGFGLDQLMSIITGMLPAQMEITALIPFSHGELLSRLHNDGTVCKTEYTAEGTKVRALIDAKHAALFIPFIISGQELEA